MRHMSCGCLGRVGQCVTHTTAGRGLSQEAGNSLKQAQAGSVQDEKAAVERCASNAALVQGLFRRLLSFLSSHPLWSAPHPGVDLDGDTPMYFARSCLRCYRMIYLRGRV